MRSRSRLASLVALTVVLGLAASSPGVPTVDAEAAAPLPDKPNIVVLLLDDATVADVSRMPRVQRLLADRGTTFVNNYTPFPQCCPARATILSGQYPHNHRVLDINPPYGGFERFDDRHTIATYLDDTYRTGIVGKYMNKFERDSPVSPGWDVFEVPVRGVYNYLEQVQKNADGSFTRVEGYLPLKHAEQLKSFIDGTPPTEPYFGYLAWVAPHSGVPKEKAGEPPSPYVAGRFRGTYDGPPLPTDASFNEKNIDDKRRAMQERPRLTRAVKKRIRYVRRQRRESLAAVDLKVEQIVELVRSRGELDNTYFILTSDNGYMEGQHRIPSGKMQPYEESAAVPLLIRGPGFAAGARYRGVTGLQDLVPTILDLSGTPLPPGAPEPDGVSLKALVDGTRATKRPQIVEIAKNTRARNERRAYDEPPWLVRSIVTRNGWKYMEFPLTDEVEMYNLNDDPGELRNLSGRPRHQARQAALRRMLHEYQDCAGATCRS